ncbi:unnamed protein product [marine sediment metagenome]|uniref:Uncharacterized protein n=1 Tax=marine sediment metagenome TaxID=412755 RepID=X0VUD6_9ZZZZ
MVVDYVWEYAHWALSQWSVQIESVNKRYCDDVMDRTDVKQGWRSMIFDQTENPLPFRMLYRTS